MLFRVKNRGTTPRGLFNQFMRVVVINPGCEADVDLTQSHARGIVKEDGDFHIVGSQPSLQVSSDDSEIVAEATKAISAASSDLSEAVAEAEDAHPAPIEPSTPQPTEKSPADASRSSRRRR